MSVVELLGDAFASREAFCFFPPSRMDAKRLRKVRDLVYGEPKPRPKWPRKPFHLSWRFDLFVVLATIVLVIAYFAI